MESYTKTMEILHKKLLQARTKDQEDRIVNLMLAEARRYRKTEELKVLDLKDSNSTA